MRASPRGLSAGTGRFSRWTLSPVLAGPSGSSGTGGARSRRGRLDPRAHGAFGSSEAHLVCSEANKILRPHAQNLDMLWLSMRALYFDLTALLRGIVKVFVTECKNSRSGVRFGVSCEWAFRKRRAILERT